MSGCAVAKCRCSEFKPQKWISLKCHTCYHWESEHTLLVPRLSVDPGLEPPTTPRTPLSRSGSPSSSPMSPRGAIFISPRKPPPSPPPFAPPRRAPPPPPSQTFPPSRKTKEDEEIKLFVIPSSPHPQKPVDQSDDSVRSRKYSEENSGKVASKHSDELLSGRKHSEEGKSSQRSPHLPKSINESFRSSIDDPSILRELRAPAIFPSKTRRGGFIDLEHETLMPAGSTPRLSTSTISGSPSRARKDTEETSRTSSELLNASQFRHSWSHDERGDLRRDTPPMSVSRLRRSSSVCNAVERQLSGIERRLSIVEQMLDPPENRRKSVQDIVSDALLIIKQHEDLSPEQTSVLENMVRSGSINRVQRAISILETKSSQDVAEETHISRSKSKQEASPRGSFRRSSVSKSPSQTVTNHNVSAAYIPIHDLVQEREEPLLQTLALGTDPARSTALLERFHPKRILGSGANGCAVMVLRKDEGIRYAAKFIPLFTTGELDQKRIFMEPAYSEALISCLVSGLPHYITCEEIFTVDYATLSAWFGTMRATTFSRNQKEKENEAKQAQITFLARFRGSKAKSYLVVVQELCQMTLDHFLVLHRRGLNDDPPENEHFSLSLPPPSPDEMRYIMFSVTFALLVGKLTLGLLWNDLANRNILLQPLEGEPQESYTYHIRDSYDGFEETFVVPGHCLPQVNGYYFEVKLVDFGVAEAHGGALYTRKEKRCYRSMTDKRVMKVAGGLEDKDLIDLEGTLMRTLHNDHLRDVPNELLSDHVPKTKKTGWLEHQSKVEAAAAANHDWYLSILKGRPAIQSLKRALKHKFYRPFRQKSNGPKQTVPQTPKTPFEPSSKSRSSTTGLFSFHTAAASSSSASTASSSCGATPPSATSSFSSSIAPSLVAAAANPTSSFSSPSVAPAPSSSATSSFSSKTKPSRTPAEPPSYDIAYPNNSRSRARLASLSGTLASTQRVVAPAPPVSFDFEIAV